MLVLVIAVISFAFSLRAAEYLLMRDIIDNVASQFTTVGFVQRHDPLGDISGAADFISSSRHVVFEDRRRTAEGVIRDILAVDMAGMPAYSEEELIPILNHQHRHTIGYFYGELLTQTFNERIENRISFMVDEVLAGFPEFVYPGQRVFMPFTEDLQEMEVGQRYFMRGFYTYKPSPMFFGAVSYPTMREQDNHLIPLSLNNEGLMYIKAPNGENIDLNLPEYRHITAEIEWLRYNHRAVLLQTTKDMNLMGSNLSGFMPFRLFPRTQGRLLDMDDYINKNHAVVVDYFFADRRGLVIGDTLILDIYPNQYISGINTAVTAGGLYNEFVIRSEQGEGSEPRYTLELEIVGIVSHGLIGIYPISPMFMYIPDSILPEEFGFLPNINKTDIENLSHEYLLSSRYSFVLNDARHEQEFFLEFREELAQMGYELIMLWSRIGSFWVTARGMMITATFNAILVSFILVLVLVLISFVYMHQRRRDFAVLCALGVTKPHIFLQLSVSLMFIGLPPIAAGSIFGWHYALNQAGVAMGYFGGGFVMVIAAVFLIFLLSVFSMAVYIVHRPILEMLQGIYFKPKEKKKSEQLYCEWLGFSARSAWLGRFGRNGRDFDPIRSISDEMFNTNT
jgi:hypothetical protein